MYKNIDEAIEEFKYCAMQNYADLDITFAKGNEQVVAWLEELKALKQGNCTNNCEHYDSTMEYVRNKAIEEFAERLKTSELAWDWCCYDETNELCGANHCDRCMAEFKEKIDEIAESMKGGKQ